MKKDIGKSQFNIFDLIKGVSHKQAAVASHTETMGKAGTDAAVRAIISAALKACPAAKMSGILGVEITKAQLDSWSAESKENHRFPHIYAGAFCQAIGDKALARCMAQLCGGYYIEGEDAIRSLWPGSCTRPTSTRGTISTLRKTTKEQCRERSRNNGR